MPVKQSDIPMSKVIKKDSPAASFTGTGKDAKIYWALRLECGHQALRDHYGAHERVPDKVACLVCKFDREEKEQEESRLAETQDPPRDPGVEQLLKAFSGVAAAISEIKGEVSGIKGAFSGLADRVEQLEDVRTSPKGWQA